MIRRLPFVAAVLLAVATLAPISALAQRLNVPLSSGTRPIQTEILFHELFADFFKESDGTTYVQTGDIPAMWLRDSAAQTIPYVRFLSTYPTLRSVFFGVIARDAKNILVDPYAEAFSADYHIWERKWEIDSLAWPVLLVFVYYANTHDRSVFTPPVHRAMECRDVRMRTAARELQPVRMATAGAHARGVQPEYRTDLERLSPLGRPGNVPV